jgi:type I restriction enzyme R subunit
VTRTPAALCLLRSFKDYYYGYESVDGKPMPGYVDMIEELERKVPAVEAADYWRAESEGFYFAVWCNPAYAESSASFDEFKGKEIITERDLQDYLGRYQDLRDEWKET